MASRTILIESNNTSSKIYTNRQLRKGVIGNQNIKKDNSRWKTDLKYGVQVDPGDEITISGSQINLRGEPNASMEFSGDLNSEYDEENSLLDNVSTVEYGYYFTNTRQYNFNLPMSRHSVVGGTRWWKRDFGLWGGENPEPAFTKGWEAFARSYPAWGIEGCYKCVESQPVAAPTTESDRAQQVNTVTRWQIIDTAGEVPSTRLPPSLGRQKCGKFTEVAISNGPFSICHSNEKRLYLLDDFTSYTSEERLTSEDYVTNSTDILKSDNVVLSAPIGFQTPSSVAQGLTEQIHQRKGQADNWENEFTTSNIYLHDAQFFLVRPVPAVPASEEYIENGGYRWARQTKLNKYPVSQITDKMLKTIKTAGGSLLEAIYDKKEGWENFVADIPGNPGWRGSIDVTDESPNQDSQGTWNNLPHTPGDYSELRADTYEIEAGKELFYENLLCGEIGRHNSLTQLKDLVAGNGYNCSDFLTIMSTKSIPSWNELFSNRILNKRASHNNSLYRDLVFINEGNLITYAMSNSDWDPAALPSDGTKANQFGAQKIVSTDFWGVEIIDGSSTQSPALVERDYPAIDASANDVRTGNTVDSHFDEETSGFVVKKSENMVWPTNIVATPRSIAQLKKVLYASRKTKNFGEKQLFDGGGVVKNDCKNKNIAKLDVAELDYYFLDDGATVNTNSPDGYADPNGLTGKYALPCPFACSQCQGLGAPSGFDAVLLNQHPNYKSNSFNAGGEYVSPPTEPFQYTNSEGGPSNPKRLQPSMRQGSRNNRLNFKTSWDDSFENKIEWADRETQDGIYLNPISIFKFTDDNDKPFQHNEWFKPQDSNKPLFDDGEGGRYDLWDDQEPEMDNGVALCVVYYKRIGTYGTGDQRVQITNNYPGVNPTLTPGGIEFSWPGFPNKDDISDQDKTNFYNTPFLALIMNKAEKKENPNNNDELREYFIAPMIGENFGISPSFSDGEYAKIVTTQRANPKAYNTITDSLNNSISSYNNYASRHNPLYYNLYDYVPYVMIGAQDPSIQFGGTSGRFEIANLHTPLYVGNGSWMDVANESDTPSAQADDKIASLNNKLAWTSTLSFTTNLRGATIENAPESTENDTRVGGATVNYINGVNKLPKQGVLDVANFYYQTNLHGLPLIPWGELQQDSNEHKVVTSQSGVGILNIFVPYSNQDINEYRLDVEANNSPYHERMSPWYPNTFEDTLLHKCGYEIEQLIPMIISSQSNSFNRSNYNKYIGYDGQNLYNKQSNMVYPFTTNGFISGPINIEGQNRNWQGYDTIYELPDLPAGELYGWGKFPKFIGIMDDRGDSSSTLRKILPPGGIYDMYSMGGLNYQTGTQVTVESDILVASKQPKKFDYSYLVIYSNIIEQQSNFIGSNKTLPLPAVGYLNRNYSSSDFFYSFVSDFKYVVDRNHIINNFDIEIRLPNGKLANLEDNSSIIFKVIKAVPLPPQLEPPKPPTKKEMTKEEHEQEIYYKSLIS